MAPTKGRGRPKKNADADAKTAKSPAKSPAGGVTKAKGRGRPKGAVKPPAKAAAKSPKVQKPAPVESASEDDVIDQPPAKSPAKSPPAKSPAKAGGRGRPKKNENGTAPAKKASTGGKRGRPKEGEVEDDEVDKKNQAPAKLGNDTKKPAGKTGKKTEEMDNVDGGTSSKTVSGKSKSKKTEPAVQLEESKDSKKETKKPKKTASKSKILEKDDDKEVEPSKKSKKRKASDDEPLPKPRKTNKKETVNGDGAAPKKTLMNATETKYSEMQFSIEKEHNYKISSWNVAGLRAWINKNGFDFLKQEQPDILCVQETKCTEDQLPDEARNVKGYHSYWLCKPGGRDGVALFTKQMPYDIKYGLGDEELDESGRIITAEYSKFYLVNTYVPNAGRGLITLDKRLRWDTVFQSYVKKLDAVKPVIICGDMNVAHNEIDLANPKTNKKNAGFTQEERDGMSKLLSLGFVDTYRHFYPDKEKQYTFWTYMGNARGKNVGWRLDYFIVSERLLSKVVDNVMRDKVLGSDHCPITMFLNL